MADEKKSEPASIVMVSAESLVDFVKIVHPGSTELSDSEIVDLVVFVVDDLGSDLEDYEIRYKEVYSSLKSEVGGLESLDEISFADLFRYNSEYVGDELFIHGVVRDVVRDINNPSSVDLYVRTSGFNFSDKEENEFIIVRYDGPQLVINDQIIAFGSVAGLEIRESVYIDNLKILDSDSRTDAVEKDSAMAGQGAQIQIPVVSASDIAILTDPFEMRSNELERIAIKIPYMQLQDNCSVLNGVVVYYRGTVLNDHVNEKGEGSNFSIDVNQGLSSLAARMQRAQVKL